MDGSVSYIEFDYKEIGYPLSKTERVFLKLICIFLNSYIQKSFKKGGIFYEKIQLRYKRVSNTKIQQLQSADEHAIGGAG